MPLAQTVHVRAMVTVVSTSDLETKDPVLEVEPTNQYGHTHTHTHPFNGPLSGTTQVSQYQKGKTNLDFTEARDSGWQWHQLGHNASLHLAPDRQPHQHPTTLMFFTGRMPFLPPNQQCPHSLVHYPQGMFTAVVASHLQRPESGECFQLQLLMRSSPMIPFYPDS